MIRILALIGLLMLALPLQVRADTHDPIATYRADLSAAMDALNEEFSLARSRGQVVRAFGNAEIDFSRRYTDRWSSTVFQHWSRMRLLFFTTDQRLADWQEAVAAGDVSHETAIAALEIPVERTLNVVARIPAWLSDDVTRLTERAFWTDLAHEVGCCDALYYHALDEANLVWSAAESPDPALIAGLQLLPPVGDVDFDAAALAFAGLTTRADALAALGTDDPVARRLLLNEAALLIDIFGEVAMATYPELVDLAARETFTTRPVAPLLALATITEPGPLRMAVLTHVRVRLEARAAYLERPAPATGLVNILSAMGTETETGSGYFLSQGPSDDAAIGGLLSDPAADPAPAPLPVPAPLVVAPQAEAAMAVAAALTALEDDSQDGLIAATRMAQNVDDLLAAEGVLQALSTPTRRARVLALPVQ